MALITVNDMLRAALDDAIDQHSFKKLSRTLDLLRFHGERYSDIVARIQKIRPLLDEAEIETLFYNADTEDSQ